MATKRRRSTAEFKARVAMEALRRGPHDSRRSRPSTKCIRAGFRAGSDKPRMA